MLKHEEGGRALFEETQRSYVWYLWVLVLIAPAILTYALITQLFFDRPFGDQPVPDLALVVMWLIFGVGLVALFLSSRLVTRVEQNGVFIRYYPFHLNGVYFPANDIEKAEARVYRPIREYGGWGIRYGWRGKAYNVRGNEGVEITLRDRRRTVLIGSQRAPELQAAVRAIMKPG